jgi:hypothetical protein
MFEALYMRSHLGLGANHMESAVLDALVAEMPPGTDEIPNPCGAHITLSYAPFTVLAKGWTVGRFEARFTDVV